MNNLRSHLSNVFKLNGFTIRSNAIKYLCELLRPINENEHEQWIEKVIEAIQKLPLSSPIIDEEVVKKAVENVSSSEIEDIKTLLRVINIFEVPKWQFSLERKKFVLESADRRCLHGEADDKALLFKNRYTIVYQRTVNHDLFRPSVPGTSISNSDNYGLVKIEYLLGLNCKQNNVIVLGHLTQLVEGEYHLEDDTGEVKASLSQAKFHTGLFTQNCFVLVEGWFEDGILHANTIGLPPAEDPTTTRALVGNVNYFGGPGTTCAKYNHHLEELEQSNAGAMIVIISDLWLDKIQVMEKLKILFEGYAFCPPLAFIFCGNFLSSSHGSSQVPDLKSSFSGLADLILKVPELSVSKFIFVPGPSDPGPGNIYPRPPLPSFITEDFSQRVPNSEFTTNPCRLLYCTQEIVIFREDIFTKMCRNSIYFPADASNIANHFARTIVCEAHLSSLPLHTVPVYWALDHCLALHPTPDVIVTADRGDPFTAKYNSATIFNPGAFLKTNFSFKVYLPASKTVEDSQVSDA
ncbi:UNVERIFIED_CONTAM: hypothetical protein RMT77_014616 [Armadillidium vulgare]